MEGRQQHLSAVCMVRGIMFTKKMGRIFNIFFDISFSRAWRVGLARSAAALAGHPGTVRHSFWAQCTRTTSLRPFPAARIDSE